MRGARDLRDEFSTFHSSAYPQLAAQTLAITDDADITRATAAATLARVWRSWPSLRGTADVLVRARWTAVLVAAERESTALVRSQQAGDAVQQITGGAAAADTVVVAALQRLPRVQRRALVLHYMGGVSVRHLSELSGSSAEHIELLLDDGFRALADSLVWSGADDEHDDLDGPDMSFDWVAEALADTAARLPAQIPAPPPTVLLRNAAVVRWSVRAIPVAGVAACAALIAAVAQPEPAEVNLPAVYAEHGSGADGSAPAYAAPSDLAPEQAADGGPRPAPTVRLRSIALTSLLDPPAPADTRASTPAPATRPRASAGGAAPEPVDAAAGAAGGEGPEAAAGGAAGATADEPGGGTAGARAGGPSTAPGPAAAPDTEDGTARSSASAQAGGPSTAPGPAAAPGTEATEDVPSALLAPSEPGASTVAPAVSPGSRAGAVSVAQLAAAADVVGAQAPPSSEPSRTAEVLRPAEVFPPTGRSQSEPPTARPTPSAPIRTRTGLLPTVEKPGSKNTEKSRRSASQEHATEQDDGDERSDSRGQAPDSDTAVSDG